ncbi:MAG TPA: hypothetical protein VM029_01355 [Opitutaceae bacterium]|nr:hypothetical protein [Opitutaceae bacterium]
MNPSEQNPPKVPSWVLYATDVAFLAAAGFIAHDSAKPLSTQAAFAIVAAVMAGAVFGLIPIIMRYERQKNEALDDRQRALEGLARTVSSSAEQISIAASGLHEIVDLAQKNLRQAENLPHKLQDKIAEFQAQLAGANDAEKEELEKELVALRSSESERLDTVSARIAKSTAEWTKLETATQQHLTAASDALGKLTLGTASAIGKAQAAAEQALAQARIEAARSVGEAAGQGARTVDAARAAALADLDAKLAAATAGLAERLAREIAAQLVPQVAAQAAAAPAVSSADSTPSLPSTPEPVAAGEPDPAPAPKRPRKPRREELAPTPEPVAEEAPVAATATAAAEIEATTQFEPTPVSFDPIPEVAPIAPHTHDPFASRMGNGDGPGVAVAAPPVVVTDVKVVTRKRAKKPETPLEPEPTLELENDAPSGGNGGSIERVLSSDGATRIIVTSYIGIGNRLFIRGEGPGLSWDKGVPLQFVSIGKWRWETNDAVSAIRFKLFKNDESECTALGAQDLEPGHQQELTAAF